MSFDEAVAAFPGALRGAGRSYSQTEIAARAPIEGGAIALVGLSHKYGTIIGAVFPYVLDFAPVIPMRSFFSPALPSGSFSYAGDRDAVIAIASEPLVGLPRGLPLATGRSAAARRHGRPLVAPRVERVERQLSEDVDGLADQVAAMRRKIDDVAFELCAIDGVSDQLCEDFEALRQTVDALRSAIPSRVGAIDQPVRRAAPRRAVAGGRRERARTTGRCPWQHPAPAGSPWLRTAAGDFPLIKDAPMTKSDAEWARHYTTVLRENLPLTALDYFARFMEGDEWIGASLFVVAPSQWRGYFVLWLYHSFRLGQVSQAVFRDVLAYAWEHDDIPVKGAAGFAWHDDVPVKAAAPPRDLTQSMFRAAEFPLRPDLAPITRIDIWRGTAETSLAAARRGFSWTTHRDYACWHATEHVALRGGGAWAALLTRRTTSHSPRSFGRNTATTRTRRSLAP